MEIIGVPSDRLKESIRSSQLDASHISWKLASEAHANWLSSNGDVMLNVTVVRNSSLMSPMNQPPHMESRACSGSHHEKSCKKATALILTKKIQVRNQYQVAPLASITRLEDLLVPDYEDLLDHTFRIIQPSECEMWHVRFGLIKYCNFTFALYSLLCIASTWLGIWVWYYAVIMKVSSTEDGVKLDKSMSGEEEYNTGCSILRSMCIKLATLALRWSDVQLNDGYDLYRGHIYPGWKWEHRSRYVIPCVCELYIHERFSY